MHKTPGLMLLAIAAVLSSPQARAQQIVETPRTMLAAQIRAQGFACDKPLGAVKDKKRSRPDHATWILQCSNATYRVTRAPDMAARVQPLP